MPWTMGQPLALVAGAALLFLWNPFQTWKNASCHPICNHHYFSIKIITEYCKSTVHQTNKIDKALFLSLPLAPLCFIFVAWLFLKKHYALALRACLGFGAWGKNELFFRQFLGFWRNIVGLRAWKKLKNGGKRAVFWPSDQIPNTL